MREELRSVRPIEELAVFLVGEAGGDEVAHHAGLVDRRDDAVARGGERTGGVNRLLEHGGEVETRVGAQDGRAECGGARAGLPGVRGAGSSGPFISGLPRFGQGRIRPGFAAADSRATGEISVESAEKPRNAHERL